MEKDMEIDLENDTEADIYRKLRVDGNEAEALNDIYAYQVSGKLKKPFMKSS